MSATRPSVGGFKPALHPRNTKGQFRSKGIRRTKYTTADNVRLRAAFRASKKK
jgi:hypothetical protein